MQNYKPIAGVWEITYACNMRCKHCGSSCGAPLKDELTTDETLKLCDDLAELGIERLTLSGGEPFMRPDWHVIAKRLTQNGVKVNAISNGWFIDDALLDKAFENGILNIGISIDGFSKTHDDIRKKGSWDRSMRALATMQQRGMRTVVCTSVNRKNLNELKRIRKQLLKLNVQRWQFQVASPMGNLLDHPELIMTPDDLPELVEFCHQTIQNTPLIVDLADDVGYMSSKDEAIRHKCAQLNQKSPKTCRSYWRGCQAGKYVIGIRANGDISPCLSIRDDSFLEANIRNIPLKEIWTRPNAFSRTRNLTAGDLEGFCRTCPYATTCLGGCTGLKLTFQKHLFENTFCMFRIEMDQIAEEVKSISTIDELLKKARTHTYQKQYPQAWVYINRISDINPNHLETIKLAGFIHFAQGNYDESLACNETALRLCNDDLYALKGKGLCLTRLGDPKHGIELLKQAAEKTNAAFMDPYYDLAVVFMEKNHIDNAKEILDQGCEKSPAFLNKARPLYIEIKKRRGLTENIACGMGCPSG